MIGQYSNAEFQAMRSSKVSFINVAKGLAWIKYGKRTINYYQQHSDESWTNYDCKTN